MSDILYHITVCVSSFRLSELAPWVQLIYHWVWVGFFFIALLCFSSLPASRALKTESGFSLSMAWALSTERSLWALHIWYQLPEPGEFFLCIAASPAGGGVKGGCSTGELISLLLCFQTWRATFLHSANACSAWEGFPPALPCAQISEAESLESPGWISLEFHHQPPTFRGLLPFIWALHVSGVIHFCCLACGKA